MQNEEQKLQVQAAVAVNNLGEWAVLGTSYLDISSMQERAKFYIRSFQEPIFYATIETELTIPINIIKGVTSEQIIATLRKSAGSCCCDDDVDLLHIAAALKNDFIIVPRH